MFNNVVLDIFIGLIFIYLLYSLLATIVQEIIASRFGLRARMLQKAIRRMLDDDAGRGPHEANSLAIKNYWNEVGTNAVRFFKPFISTNSLSYKFYSHPTIKYLGEGRLFSKPSYLHGHNFAQTLIQLLRGEDYDGRTQNESMLINQALQSGKVVITDTDVTINPQTLKHLKMLFADSRQDSYLFKQKLEDWFGETMDRTTGWYKKQTQTLLIMIGFVIAASFNIDSIAIAKILTKDKKIREQIVQLAVSKQGEYGKMIDSLKIIKTTTTTRSSSDSVTTTTIDSVISTSNHDKYLDAAYQTLSQDATTVQGILGLKGITSNSDSATCIQASAGFDSLIAKEPDLTKKGLLIKAKEESYQCCLEKFKKRSPYQNSDPLKYSGWLITALAISLGAPFWFDLLNKLVKLRASGPKADTTAAMDRGSAATPVKDKNDLEIKG